jgi:hypothetical protein
LNFQYLKYLFDFIFIFSDPNIILPFESPIIYWELLEKR